MPTIDLEGASFHFDERGAGPPLFLIPGTGGHVGALAAVTDRLAATHRVIAYDRRGHGRTEGALGGPKGYLARHVADATALLPRLGCERATVFGWSWGGLVALGLAVERPDLVSALVLHEPPWHAKRHPTVALLGGFGGAIVLGKLGMPRRGARRFARFVLARRDATNAFDDLEPSMRESILANSRTIVVELEAGTGEELSTSALGRIRCPTTLIVGDRSRELFHAAAARVHASIPASRLLHVPDGDHLMCVLRPDELARAIAEALAPAAAPTATMD